MHGVMRQENGDNWTLYEGDSCEIVKGIPDNSVDMCLYSPPFSTLYVYSASDADMGNCRDNAEFLEHYRFLVEELLRVTVPGRLCLVHCKDLPKYANRDDTAGLIDFPGQLIRVHEECGWSFHSRVTIWKCPVLERERTNNNGLLHKTVKRDRSQLRMGMADYLLGFRKIPASGLMSDKPVTRDGGKEEGFATYHGASDFRENGKHPSPYARKTRSSDQSIDVWRRYAEPVWWDIDVTDVLNYKEGRSDRDERHICPLQMGIVRRAVQIWSNDGDVVFTPFAGIGSEMVGAIQAGRRAMGIELNSKYLEVACGNLRRAAAEQSERLLFDGIEAKA